MECWIEQKIGGMSSFEERQAALVTQVLGGYSSVTCDLPLIEQSQQQNLLHRCYGGVSNLELYGFDGICDVRDLGWQHQQVVSGCSDSCYEVVEPCEQRLTGSRCYEVAEPFDERLNGGDCTVVAAMPVLDEMSLVPSWVSQPKLEDSSACTQPPAKRLRNTAVAYYILEDIINKLTREDGALVAPLGLRKPHLSPAASIPPPPQFSSDVSLASYPPRFPDEISDERPQQQRYRKPVPRDSVEPQSVAARHRRMKIREKIRSLERLIPPGSKLDTARMLEESYKYVKFLQAQVKLLESLPSSSYEVEDVKAVMTLKNGNAKDYVKNVNSMAPRSNPSIWNVTGSLSMQRPSSVLKKLSTQQILHILVTSPTIQRKLFIAENCVATLQQKEMLANSEAFLSSNLSKE